MKSKNLTLLITVVFVLHLLGAIGSIYKTIQNALQGQWFQSINYCLMAFLLGAFVVAYYRMLKQRKARFKEERQ